MESKPMNRSRLILMLKDDKTFKTTVTLILAGLTIVTSLIVIFNVQASARVPPQDAFTNPTGTPSRRCSSRPKPRSRTSSRRCPKERCREGRSRFL